MNCLLRSILMLLIACFPLVMSAQSNTKSSTIYTVKKKDTVYGIAHRYNITIDELLKANPGVVDADFNLKKGTELVIPQPKTSSSATAVAKQQTTKVVKEKKKNAVTIGVMLPLHQIDGDGKRMLEYYRGVLMACDSLKTCGISTTVYSWNVPSDKQITAFLNDANLQKCDVVFGPLYTFQVAPLASFCKENGIRLVIPFSISSNAVTTNHDVFQVYQPADKINARTINAFMERFKGRHVVFIDGNDSTSRKGVFTMALRKRLEENNQTFSITNLKSSETSFSKAFSRTLSNVVVLNTSRSPELNVTFAKLNNLRATDATVSISMFGYTEWLMYTKVYLELFHKYDTYIPTTFFYNPLNRKTVQLEQAYQRWFHSDMQTALPRFAIVGYDHAQYFVRGIAKYGKRFSGAAWQNVYTPLQSLLKFEPVGDKGGFQNNAFMLVHYRAGGNIDSISY